MRNTAKARTETLPGSTPTPKAELLGYATQLFQGPRSLQFIIQDPPPMDVFGRA